MHIPEDDTARFEELDDQRRRVDDDFNLVVQQMRSGSIRNDDRLRIEVQQLQVKHTGILRAMVDLLVP